MKITVNRSDLLVALKRAGVAINQAYSPTRSSVIIRAERDGIRMGSTDGTLGVALELPGAVNAPGRAMLPHKRLSAIAAELPEGDASSIEISVDLKNFATTVKALGGKRKFTMSGHDPNDYPPVLEAAMSRAPGHSFALEAKSFVSAAADVKQSIDASRVDGALLQPVDKVSYQMVAVGTSLSIASGSLVEAETTSLEGILIPSVLLETGSALVGKSGANIRVHRDNGRVSLESDGCVITCAELYGSFPDWWRMPVEQAPTQKIFRCSAERFLESVRAVSVAADVEGAAERFVQIDVSYMPGECVVSTRKSVKNYGEDELPITPGEGSDKPCLIHLDGQRLSLALRAAAPGDVDVFYDVVGAQETFFLKGDSFWAMFPPVRVVDAPPAGSRGA